MNVKKIDTLCDDIYKTLETGVDIKVDTLETEAKSLTEILKYRLSPKSKEEIPSLRFSNLGTKCNRKLWYTINKPEAAEKITGQTYLKFLYGDILEWLVLLLAKASGHRVEGQQTTLEIEGIKGHRDAIVDGTLIDVKSASRFGFEKFKYHKVDSDDPFGYMDQLSLYHAASLDEVENKDEAGFIAIEKESGELAVDVYRMDSMVDWSKQVSSRKDMVASDQIPERGYAPKPYGKSGNEALGVECSYCPFKRECYPGLRTFLYSGRPVHLTRVERLPDVPEIRYEENKETKKEETSISTTREG